jgi:photosystem II stability/assembly factor-like uncharacterized protein
MKSPMLNTMFKNILSIILVGTVFTAVAQQPTAAMKSKLAPKQLMTDITLAGSKLVAVGERGHILISEDGEQWQQANVPVNVLLTSIDFKNDNVGFVTGHDATLLKTTDGGLNWSIVNYQPELDKPLLDIKVLNNNVIAVGAYGLFLQSTDAGETWQDSFQDELLIEDDRLYLEELKEFEPDTYIKERQYMLPHFNSINVIGEELYIAGEAGFLANSDVNGADWQVIETDYFGSYFSIVKVEDSLLLAGLRGNLFKSEDDGESWRLLNTGVKATINSAFKDSQVTYFFANSGNVFYTLDNEVINNYVLDDGKAVMAGVVLNNFVYLATEAGIKKVPTSEFTSNKARD